MKSVQQAGSAVALLRTAANGNDPLCWTTTDDVDVDGLSDIRERSHRPDLADSGAGDLLETAEESIFTWSSVSGKVYSLWICTNLACGEFQLLETPISSTPPLNTFTTSVENAESVFYQLQVDE